MTAIKESSVIQANKQLASQLCPVTYVMEKIGGYWKPIILFQLLSGSKRYGELRRSVPSITEKVLIQQLKQLETDGLVSRKAEPVIPPHVTYSLTKSGKAMRDVLWAMANWAAMDSKESGKVFKKNMKNFPG
ncbi:winged helix-turn-helix transcriptional regulator [Chitinophaga qingshengii]|uniref:Helix-turn-helix transcriptional regulator n=1 Tax=Chitinophaga qingshengii TaxID=1569794 RepID=A0ABR7TPE6_9BACT|nr:helix-turn-helix domain-containing protein [Chitinophaga qingshengii]MBC9931304.1 helix-turn-helix transcriptional regulator [Chitinophaga qingshengii]